MDSCIIRILFGGCSQGCRSTHTPTKDKTQRNFHLKYSKDTDTALAPSVFGINGSVYYAVYK